MRAAESKLSTKQQKDYQPGAGAKAVAGQKDVLKSSKRASPKPAAKKAAKYKLAPEKHKVMVRHAKDAKWENGLRGHMTYRDTGIAYATNGEFGALVMRPREPGIAIAHPGKHRHGTGFQMVYILGGSARFWLEGIGEIKVEKGDCFYQPDNVLHQALEISDDLELLEITMPAEFETTTP